MQNHAIEGADGAQIDLDPLGSIARALPGAGEIVRTAEIHPQPLREGVEGGHPPAGHRGGFDLDAVEAGRPLGGHVEGGLHDFRTPEGLLRQFFLAAGLAQFPPGLSVVGSADHTGPTLRILVFRARNGDYLDVIDRGRVVASGLFDLHPAARGREVDARTHIAVDHMLPFVAGQDAFCAGRANEPAGQPVIDDPVGDQLGGQVEIIVARRQGRAMEREVAISRRVRDKSRSSKRGRIARINPDTPGEITRCECRTGAQQRCEQRDPK